jgi:3-oxoacyl-[acyl-carrier-protein] synthase II
VHVNAHATSTPQGDVTEASSIKQSLGRHRGDRHRNQVDDRPSARWCRRAGVAGHPAGLRYRKVPPTINLDNPEPDLVSTSPPRSATCPTVTSAAINNSFGFGGHNVAVAFTNAYATGGLR